MQTSRECTAVCRPVKLLFIISLLVLFAWQSLLAQAPHLVKDINPTQDVASSNAGQFVAVGNVTFFTAYVPNEGYELWKTDGTAAGTTLVIDRYFSRPSNLTSSNGKLFFINDGLGSVGVSFLNGTVADLWMSDGTAAGTKMLRHVSEAASLSGGGVLADVNGTLFFASDGGALGTALWKTDGTDAGTVMVKAMPPATCAGCLSGPANAPLPTSLTAANGRLFFVTGTSGFVPMTGALWTSDGTDAGTVTVTSGTNLNFTNLINVNGELFFTATDIGTPTTGTGSFALWKSDGTPAGTMTVLSFAASIAPQEFTNVNGTLFFRTLDESTADFATKLWKSDGMAEGTVPVADICISTCSTVASYLTNLNGTLFYSAQGGLWKTDGTPEGTVLIAGNISPSDLAALNGAVYFGASGATNGRELWVSDGTANGTALVKDICPGACNGFSPPGPILGLSQAAISGSGSSNFNLLLPPLASSPAGLPSRLSVSNGRLYFSGCEPVNQCEPWISNGTDAGTYLLKNIALNTSSRIGSAFDFDGTLLFSALDGTATKLWRSDGTDAGTGVLNDVVILMLPLAPLNGSVSLAGTAATLNGNLFFAGGDSTHGYELWKTDGTTAGTVLVKDINPGTASSRPSSLFAVNGAVLFLADDGTHGRELWKSDGTAAGTALVKDINPSGNSDTGTLIVSSAARAATVNGTLFFATTDGSVWGLWKSDGTEAGTVQVAAFPPPSSSTCGVEPTLMCGSLYGPASLINVNGTLFFTANQGELWKSDGTADGTVAVASGATVGLIQSLTNVNGTLFFASLGSLSTNFIAALWKSDGTTNGTVIVRGFIPKPTPLPGGGAVTSISSSLVPNNLTNVNGTLFFTASDDSNNLALWKSDGTSEGTVIVRDAPASRLASVNGLLYFASADDSYGTELWKSNGSASGTVMVADINPGTNGSFPQVLATSHGRMFFTANDGTHGTELWTLTVAPTTVTLTSAARAAVVGKPITITATVASIVPGSFSGTVYFMDGAAPLGSALVDAGGVATLTTSSLPAGTHAISATYSGDPNYPDGTASSTVTLVILAVAPDYTLSAAPTSQTVRAGQSATFTIHATADQYFDGTVSFACGTLPKGVSCSFSPPTLNPLGASPAQTQLTVMTTSRSAALMAPPSPGHRSGEGVFWAGMSGVGVFGCLLITPLSRRKRIALLALALALLAFGLVACGTASNPNGTPRGDWTVQVTATATAGTTGGNTAPHQLSITIHVP